jgi:hypothetical protein
MLEGLRRQVTDLAGTAALMIDPAWVRQQVDEAPATGKLSSLLGLIQAQNPDIRYVWVMRRTGRTPTEMAFIAVSASGAMPAASPRTEKPRANPEPARPGQLFEAAPFPALLEGFERPAADPTDEVADEWGVALSGYAPIKDEAGRSIAVLGVDISRDDLDDELADLDRALAFSLTLAATLAASALLLILATVVGRWGRKAQAPER